MKIEYPKVRLFSKAVLAALLFLCNRKVLVKMELCKLGALPLQSTTIRR